MKGCVCVCVCVCVWLRVRVRVDGCDISSFHLPAMRTSLDNTRYLDGKGVCVVCVCACVW